MKRRKVLIADDDRRLRAALGVRLRDWGYRAVESGDGLGVIRLASRESVDAIVLDFDMPGGDGCTIARMIRRESDAPIIFLSGFDRERFRTTVRELPDTYYLPKPLDAERLRTLLDACVGARLCEATA